MRLALFLLLWSCLMHGQDVIIVTASEVLHDIRDRPFGLNLNTLTDGQANRPKRAADLTDAITAGGFRALRFPGGEKSDAYAWAAPPYDNPATAYLIRRGENDWPANDSRFWDATTGTWANDNYNFDEFVADCRASGAEPIVVVAFDGMYLPASEGGTGLSRELALELATEWVRYANVTKKYGIKYWSLGNETWQDATYAGANPGFTTYGRDAAVFARAMKEVDPTILVGINGRTTADFREALAECADVVDWLDVHTYPCWGFQTYDDYRAKNPDPRWIVDRAQEAIDELADPAVRDKLSILMTEVSAYAFRQQNAWDSGSNLGQALANFDIMAQLLEDERVAQTLFWNSRWIQEDVAGHLPTDFFTGTNELNGSGLALSVLSGELLDEMVATTSSGYVRAFATRSAGNDRLNLFLLNKDTGTRSVELNLEDFFSDSEASRSVLTGDSPSATEITYAAAGALPVGLLATNLTLPATSVTVLRFRSSNSPSEALPVELLDFRAAATPAGHTLQWEVEDEIDLAGYHLESSVTGREWLWVATLPARGIPQYQYTDAAATGTYYRLRMEDLDGSSRLSEVVRLPEADIRAGAYPNPARGRVTLPAQLRGKRYQLFTQTGQLMKEGRIPHGGRVPLPPSQPGVYHVVVGGERFRVVSY